MAHVLLLWEGDVLALYALAGLLLPWLWGLLLAPEAFGLLLVGGVWALGHLDAAGLGRIDAAVQAQVEAGRASAVAALGQGGPPELFARRVSAYRSTLP